MPKTSQIVVTEGKGRARRLMVKAKKGSKRKTANRSVYDHTAPHRFYPSIKGEWVEKAVPIDGCFRGTKKVPKENAVKHPKTGLPQLSEILVQIGVNIASLPASDAEFYWQKGEIRAGMRFVPDNGVAAKPLPDPQSDQPTP